MQFRNLIQPIAATNPIFLSPYRYTEESPLLTNDTSSRVPGVCHQQSVSRDSHYGVYGGYRKFEQNGRVLVPKKGEYAKVFFVDLVVLTAEQLQTTGRF